MCKKIMIVLFTMLSVLLMGVSTVHAAEEVANAKVLTTGIEDIATFPTYTVSVPTEKYTGVISYPISVDSGGELYVRCYNDSFQKVEVFLSTNASGSGKIGTDYTYIDVAASYTCKKTVDKGGIYYVCFGGSFDGGNISIQPYTASAANRTLKNNEWTVGAPRSSNGVTTYYRVDVPSSGYISIVEDSPNGSGLSVDICNGSKMYLKNSSVGNEAKYYPVSKGTYYIRTSGDPNTWYRIKYNFITDLTLGKGETLDFKVFSEYGTDYYVKIKPEKSGKIFIENSSNDGCYITLCNSKKNPISRGTSYYWIKDTWNIVRKNQVYYIKLNGFSGDNPKLRYKISGLDYKKNTSKVKALAMKRNRTVRGAIVTGEKSSYWYKFKLTKKAKLNINYVSEVYGGSKVKLYKGRRVIPCSVINNRIITYTELSKGNYYLRITPKKFDEGRYELKLKNR